MKKQILLILVLVVVSCQCLQAQSEIKISPFALLVPAGAVAFEYGISDEFGLEVDGIVAEGGGYVSTNAKYYFNPREGLDRFHVGMFIAGGSDIGAGVGFLIGSKIVSTKNILFEFGIGLGRSLSGDGAVGYWKLHVGYRLRE